MDKVDLLSKHFNLEGIFKAEMVASGGISDGKQTLGPYTMAKTGISIFHGCGGGDSWYTSGTLQTGLINAVSFNNKDLGISGRNVYAIKECKVGDTWHVTCSGRQRSGTGSVYEAHAYFQIFIAYMA